MAVAERPAFQIHRQRGRKDCGVATLATLLGRTYEEVLVVAGRIAPTVLRKGLYSSDLVRIAAEFDVLLTRRVQKIDLEDHTGILGLEYSRKRFHAVFLTHGLIFDPQEDYIAWDAETFVKREKARIYDLLEEA